MPWSKFKIQNKFNKLLFRNSSNPYQPRKEFDEEGLAELAESIRQMESSNQLSFVSLKLKDMSLWLGNVVCVRLN